MGEDHINKALYSKDKEIPPSGRDLEQIAYPETPSKRNESAQKKLNLRGYKQPYR
jgi:hypothetical protein